MFNPVPYGEDITYTWSGRQLLEYKNSNPDDYIRCVYTYDADGLRTRKLVYKQKSSTDTTEYLLKQYDYVWKDGILDSEKYVSYDEDGVVTKTVVYKYLYDEYNSPIGIALWVDGEKNGNYWYIKNAQGDVTAIYCEGQGIVVNYNYDAYGNMKAVAGESGLAGAVVMILYNSITYRGYYFDIDTNLYYLQSRYYSPTWGRFLNADDVEYLGVSGTALSYNLYAYCENNPVMYIDPRGTASKPAPVISGTVYGYSYSGDFGYNTETQKYKLTVCIEKTFVYAAYKKGIVSLDNASKDVGSVFQKGQTQTLAYALINLAREINEKSLKKRTINGVAFELLAHYVWYKKLPVGRKNTKVSDVGSIGSNNLGYDKNAHVFEDYCGKFATLQSYVSNGKWIRAIALLSPVMFKVYRIKS